MNGSQQPQTSKFMHPKAALGLCLLVSGLIWIPVHLAGEESREHIRSMKLVELKDGRKVFVSPKYIEEHKDEINE